MKAILIDFELRYSGEPAYSKIVNLLGDLDRTWMNCPYGRIEVVEKGHNSLFAKKVFVPQLTITEADANVQVRGATLGVGTYDMEVGNTVVMSFFSKEGVLHQCLYTLLDGRS